MSGFNNQQTADDWARATTIENVDNSNGGSVDINGQNVVYQIGVFTPTSWGDEILAKPGALILPPGVSGFRVKNAVRGQASATVSAHIAGAHELVAQVSASSSAASAAATTVTGIIPAAGTTPLGGTGFTYMHTNGTGIYVFTFAVPFAAQPVVLVTPLANNAQAEVSASSASGFTVQTRSNFAALTDEPFDFLVTEVV